MATKINGIEIPVGFGASLGGATTPEESAKAFLRLASIGLADVMKNAVVGALSETLGAGPTPDWTKFISGCVVELDWETLPGTPVQTVIATSKPSSSALGGIDVEGSFTIKGHF